MSGKVKASGTGAGMAMSSRGVHSGGVTSSDLWAELLIVQGSVLCVYQRLLFRCVAWRLCARVLGPFDRACT